jgi:hypothetical protein
MTQPTDSDTSITDLAANSQVSAEPSEFPPPSPKANLEIIILPDGKVRTSRWKRFVWILARSTRKAPATTE